MATIPFSDSMKCFGGVDVKVPCTGHFYKGKHGRLQVVTKCGDKCTILVAALYQNGQVHLNL